MSADAIVEEISECHVDGRRARRDDAVISI
jgi:hypothetical protein